MTKRLLVADDALITRALIKDAARDAGWEVVGEAENGAEVIERYKELQPDAVTLDLVMPEYDGLYALRGILEYDPGATAIVVSAVDQKRMLQSAYRLGATDFLVKPFDKSQLISTLETHAPKSQAVRRCRTSATRNVHLPRGTQPTFRNG